MLTLGLIALCSYLIGAIPTSIIVSKLVKGIDIREHGSGNAGGTNVFRVLGWQAGLFVTLVDMLKGFLPVTFLVGYFVSVPIDELPDLPVVVFQLVAGVSAMIGHVYTVFARFKGGKGVSTGAGVLIGVAPITMAFVILVFFATLFLTRYVSVSSMTSAASIPIIMTIRRFAFGAEPDAQFPIELFGAQIVLRDNLDAITIATSVVIALGIIYTHRSNIERLRKGTENRAFAKKTTSVSQ
ncbi:MAG: glycerol-3-phosphate 1-O-acyltransferase PlsY [Chloroherpetonaceae bacterium]|nr:glycerol-3-phosphate 1-O-acyltransferase PlsY [Chloroherpetonaceae bacterium]MDW8436545.1 glycerol-3-phosphate 1-O-acyltransferase PlsY [Chloroherpetonaceae bacterium]